MLTMDTVMNVNNTPNKYVSFGNGVQTNYGIKAPSPKSNMVEGSLLPGFVGTVTSQVYSRAKKIENGLNGTKLNFFA